MTAPANVAGVLLAGGRAKRMGGGDKGLRTLGGRPIIDHIMDRARPQVAALLINANGDPGRFAIFRLPVAADVPVVVSGEASAEPAELAAPSVPAEEGMGTAPTRSPSSGTATRENSRQRKRPPGRSTRRASARARSIRVTLRRPKAMV